MSRPPFWLVWNPSGRIPRFEHYSYESARQEAERLARQNPGDLFYILCPVGRCRHQQVHYEPFISDHEASQLGIDQDPEIPF